MAGWLHNQITCNYFNESTSLHNLHAPSLRIKIVYERRSNHESYFLNYYFQLVTPIKL
jgi:hypothetical protein